MVNYSRAEAPLLYRLFTELCVSPLEMCVILEWFPPLRRPLILATFLLFLLLFRAQNPHSLNNQLKSLLLVALLDVFLSFFSVRPPLCVVVQRLDCMILLRACFSQWLSFSIGKFLGFHFHTGKKRWGGQLNRYDNFTSSSDYNDSTHRVCFFLLLLHRRFTIAVSSTFFLFLNINFHVKLRKFPSHSAFLRYFLPFFEEFSWRSLFLYGILFWWLRFSHLLHLLMRWFIPVLNFLL